MTGDEPPTLEPWLSALRGDVQTMPEPARERVAARLATVGVVVAGGVAAPTLARAAGAWWRSQAFAVALALPAVPALGAAGHAYITRPVAAPAVLLKLLPRAPASVRVAAERSVSDLPLVTKDARVPQLAPASAPKRALAAPPSAEPKPPSLEQELLLLEQARTRLSEGEPQTTLKLLREHQERYPRSALQQEREALTIRALAAADRSDEARERAQRFVDAYPKSALRGSVERAVGSIP